MSQSLRLTLKQAPECLLDMSPLNPDAVLGKSQDQIKAIKLQYGPRRVSVNQIFKVTGKSNGIIEIHASHRKLHNIGKAMREGEIQVFGPTGDNTGMNMAGGNLTVQGNVGDWLGASMKGGTIEVKGRAGDFVGGGKAGEIQGMSGGMIIISGTAGDRVGDRMRRGTIFITRNAGNYCGSRMIAGSIVVMGEVGDHCGYAMKRGTIILTEEPVRLLPTFQSCGECDLTYLRLLFKQFAQMGQPLSKLNRFSSSAIRYAGDLANKGLGEIILIK